MHKSKQTERNMNTLRTKKSAKPYILTMNVTNKIKRQFVRKHPTFFTETENAHGLT